MILGEGRNINGHQSFRKGPRLMRKILLLLALATLTACSQTVHVGGEGEYYQGIVPPR
ncbi:hypothetical protein SS05631_c16400 [Sinorhizobium sp. CCBAU 05631]|nr:hypothetical protein SS05631_c16400 [Sinorhizobium sp. CCBAU 05631]